MTADHASATPRLRATRPRVRLLWMLAGVLLITGCALGFGVLAQQLADRRPVVVLSRPVERGTVVAAADLAVAQVAADPGVALMPAEEAPDLVGRVMLTSLPAGAVVTAELLGPAGVDLGAHARTVGLELDPGGYPVTTLAVGDTVTIVGTDGPGTVLSDDAVVLGWAPTVEGATTMLVSVVVDAGAAPRVAAAAAQGRVRLVLHGAGA